MPIPGGGVWVADLATALLALCVTANTPVSRWSLRCMATCSFAGRQTKA